MKKRCMYFCRLLALLLLFPALAACRQTAAPPEDGSGEISGTGEEGTQAGPGEDNTPTLVLAANGESDYTFWLSRELYATSPEIKDELADIAKLIRERTGADIPIRSDSSAEEADFAEPGILIGNTVFPESAEVDLVMKNQDFYVGMSGNKVLLCGATKTGVYNAVRYFYTNVVLKQRPDGSQPLVFSQEHVYRSGKTYPINSVLCCGTELMQYRMVIPQDADVNERMLAYNLRYHLSQQYGQDFEMVTDDAPEADFEILIGRTNRTTADAQGSGYTVAAEDGKLQLLAGNMRGYEALDAYVRQELLRAGSGADYVLADGFVHNGSPANSLDDGTLLSEERTGDLRVMFYNVYGYSDSGPVSLRQELQLELFRLYQPDVLGMQEYSPAYHSSFTSMLNGIGYQQVAVSAGTSNYTPLFYRADRLEVVESGYLRYAGDVSFLLDRAEMFVVRTEGKVLAGQIVSEDSVYQSLKIVSGAPFADVHMDAAADLFQRIIKIRGFVIRADACQRICRQFVVRQIRGVAVKDPAAEKLKLLMELPVAMNDARRVHHFPQSEDPGGR